MYFIQCISQAILNKRKTQRAVNFLVLQINIPNSQVQNYDSVNIYFKLTIYGIYIQWLNCKTWKMFYNDQGF